MNNIGTLQRRWSATEPKVYDKETRTVCLDIQPEKGNNGNMSENGEAELVDGYSYIAITIDPHIEYGHIKSQLIEAGFAQKDEFGLLMNTVGSLIDLLEVLAEDNSTIRDMLATEDILAFVDFREYRDMCADAAKVVVEAYK